MYRKRIFYVVLVCTLMALSALPAAAQDDPAQVVNSFYTWYLDYVGYDEASQEFRNPLVDGSYQERTELSTALIEEVATIRDEQGGYHYDPFLCAQDIPESLDITEVDYLTDHDAAVLVKTRFGFNPHPNYMVVSLMEQDTDGWLITKVDCQDDFYTPRGVTEAFYTWYLGQLPGGDGLQTSYPYLTDALNAQLKQNRPQGPGGGDPVLCAQDFPISIAVNEVMVGKDEATMLVREFFTGNPQPNALTVSLVYDEQWMIHDIVCEVAPETVAELLYNEFITFTHYDMERGIDRTPIADWTPHPWAQYMGEDLLSSLLAQYRSGEALPADPFLCAQDIPAWVDAERVETSGDESVTLRVSGAYPSGPETYTTYGLTLLEMALSPSGDWQIVNLTCES